MQILHIFEFGPASYLSRIQKCAESAKVKGDPLKTNAFRKENRKTSKIVGRHLWTQGNLILTTSEALEKRF